MKEFLRKHLWFLRREAEFLVIDNNSGDFRFSIVCPAEGGRHFQLISGPTTAMPVIRDNTKIIISLSHRHATTFRMPVAITRTEPKLAITETELENIVSRGLWKLFNRQRQSAALKMRATDVAVKVFDADIVGIKLDGHKVADPVGFSAREVELECQQTLAVQPALATLLEMLPPEQIVSVQEAPAAWPLLVAGEGTTKEFLALSVLSAETVLYRYADGTLECIDTFAWGSSDITKAVAGFFGTDTEEAEAVIGLYTKGNASLSVLKKVEAVLSQELSILFKGIEAHRLKREAKQVFIASEFRIPEILLGSRYIRKLGVDFTPTLLGVSWISEKLGYTLKLMEDDVQSADSVCAALAVYHSQQKDTLLSKIAKQRARWL